MMVKSYVSFLILAGFTAGSLSACGASDHGHDHGDASHHGADGQGDAHDHTADHSKFGHLSAVYLCGEEELQTFHTDADMMRH